MLHVSNIDRTTRTRLGILDAAWDLVAEQGASASIAEIAAAAGITRQSVYVHFGSRGGMLMALLKRADERGQIFERFTVALSHRDPARRLEAALDAWLAFVPGIMPVARDLVRLRSTDHDVAAAWKDRMDELLGVWRQVARSLARDKALADGWTQAEAADFIWTSSSVQTYDLLTSDRGWTHKRACRAVKHGVSRTILAP